MQEAASIAAAAGVRVWFEPVSVPKAARVAGALHLLDYISPNAAELISMSEAVRQRGSAQAPQQPETSKHWSSEGQRADQQMRQQLHQQQQPEDCSGSGTAGRRRVLELQQHIGRVLDAGVKRIVLTLGADGAAICSRR